VTAREVLLKAADIIAERGHCQGASEICGSCCVMGALDRATDDPIAYEDACVALAAHLRFGYGAGDTKRIVRWNDTPGRTAAEVIAALRGAAEGAAS
jgi:hypothetical protein